MSAARVQIESKARVLVVDDHPVMRDGLRWMIEQQRDMVCCGEAGTAAETLVAVARRHPDLVILDLWLKNADGLDLIKSLKKRFPKLRILIFSQYDLPMYLERALRAGARGYVGKDQAADEVLNAARSVLRGDIYLTRGMLTRLLQKCASEELKASDGNPRWLTDRELQVLHLLGIGMSSRDIATELGLSIKTIETYRENIKTKLQLAGAPALIGYARKWIKEQFSVPSEMLMSHPRVPTPNRRTLAPVVGV